MAITSRCTIFSMVRSKRFFIACLFTLTLFLYAGKGMQTWEYSPDYAIRSYSYVYSVFKFLQVFTYLFPSFEKVDLFIMTRIILGVAYAFAETEFVYAIKETYNKSNIVPLVTIGFLLSSPGIFYCSTSFLPSASASIFVMLATAAWLNYQNYLCIMYGSIAVLWLGWPFVAVVFLPFGIAMLAQIYFSNPKFIDKIQNLFEFSMKVIIIIALVGIPAAYIDTYYYQRKTSPLLNILFYNAGGNGDELYGIEDISYYFKNLFLNLGVIWPLAVATPIILLRNSLNKLDNNSTKLLVILCSCGLWMGILMSRPHKEERFMYPIYPLLSVLAATSLCYITDMVMTVFGNYETLVDAPFKQVKAGNILKLAVVVGVIGLNTILFSSRILSNYQNYNGFQGLWRDIHDITKKTNPRNPLRVCTGNEWYYFPSHFYLPNHLSLAFVDDGFKGQLPQYYDAVNGTFSTPTHRFNDQNKEEVSRYVSLDSCNYVVLLRQSKFNQDNKKIIEELLNKAGKKFQLLRSKPIIDKLGSSNSLTRAYFIPTLSHADNVYINYEFYENIDEIQG